MDRLRRSLRESFRRRSSSGSPSERHVGGSGNGDSLKQTWSQDEATVRSGTCSFNVKYLGSVEVGESRGMHVCEEALKVLRGSRRRPVKGVLYVSGDGIRVVDSESKGLVVDQTIEKVSFCAPDRNHEKGFAYICRDGTTRRWMCHGFHASKDSGERLSHAVGCAFAVCLERKQKRDREAQGLNGQQAKPQAPTDAASSQGSIGSSVKEDTSFQRQGSFRQASLNERLQDPQNVKVIEKPPVRPAINPHAVARPVGNRHLFERQGSLRMPNAPLKESSNVEQPSTLDNGQDLFRRFNSLRVNQLPSNLARFEQTMGAFGQDAIIEEEFATAISASRGQSIDGQSYFHGAQSNSSYFSPPMSVAGSPPRSASFDAPITNGQNRIPESFDPCVTSQGSQFTRAIDGNQASRSVRLRGEEWLETAAKQAKQLQYSRTTSPSETEQQLQSIPPSSRMVSPPVLPRLGQESGIIPSSIPSSDLGLRRQGLTQPQSTDTEFDARWNALIGHQKPDLSEADFSSAMAVKNPFSQESSSVNI